MNPLITQAIKRFEKKYVQTMVGGDSPPEYYVTEDAAELTDFLRQELEALEKRVREEERERISLKINELRNWAIDEPVHGRGYGNGLWRACSEIESITEKEQE